MKYWKLLTYHRLGTPDLTVGAKGQVKWAKVAWKSSTYDISHEISAQPKQKFFFRVQTRRLAASFELFTRFVALTGPKKFPRKDMCVRFSVFFLKIPESGWTPKC